MPIPLNKSEPGGFDGEGGVLPPPRGPARRARHRRLKTAVRIAAIAAVTAGAGFAVYAERATLASRTKVLLFIFRELMHQSSLARNTIPAPWAASARVRSPSTPPTPPAKTGRSQSAARTPRSASYAPAADGSGRAPTIAPNGGTARVLL